MFRMYTKFLEIEKKKINNLMENWSKSFNWQLTEKMWATYKHLQGEQPKQSKSKWNQWDFTFHLD